MSVGKTLNMDSCSKCVGNLEGIWGNPGEIPHIGWKIPGVYRVNRCILPNKSRKIRNINFVMYMPVNPASAVLSKRTIFPW